MDPCKTCSQRDTGPDWPGGLQMSLLPPGLLKNWSLGTGRGNMLGEGQFPVPPPHSACSFPSPCYLLGHWLHREGSSLQIFLPHLSYRGIWIRVLCPGNGLLLLGALGCGVTDLSCSGTSLFLIHPSPHSSRLVSVILSPTHYFRHSLLKTSCFWKTHPRKAVCFA